MGTTSNRTRPGFWPESDTVGLIVRWLLIVGAAVLALTEAFIDGPQGSRERNWLEILLPYLPLWGLAVRAPVGFIVWVGSLFALAAIAAPTASVASLIVPSVIVIGFCTYMFERRWALITAVIAELLSFFVPFLFLGNGLNVGALLASMVAIGVLGGLALNFYRHRAEDQESQIQDLSAKHAEVRSEERRKLGSELHDSVAHDVTVIAMQARRTRFIDDPEQVRDVVETIGTTAQQALRNLRSMVSVLREESVVSEPSVAPEGLTGTEIRGETLLPARIVDEAEQVKTSLQSTGFDVTLTVAGDVERIPSSLLPALQRSIREIGTNILKHADATQPVSLGLQVTGSSVALCSSNTISATPPISSSGAGLTAMKTRSTAFGGSLEAAAQGRIWLTRLIFPLGGATPEE